MKKISTISLFILILFSSAVAQIDQVSVGASYSQQAYYSLQTGEVESMANESWDIAFSAAGQQDAGVFINESATFMQASLQVFLAETNDWSEAITNTSAFTDDIILLNPELNWTEGAMNSIKDPSSPFDFGWGMYNPQTNIVEGDKIFVIKMRDASFIKLQIIQLAGGEYSFRYADLDGSNERSGIASKNDANGPLIYFSLENNAKVVAPTEYDLIFQRYSTGLDDGTGEVINYTVTGALLAPGAEAVVIDGVDPMNVNESDYSEQYSTIPTTIGHDWKNFDFQLGWVIDADRTQFVKTSNGDIYQVTFFDFEGSSTGTTTLEKTFITSVSTLEEEVLDQGLELFPNPTTEFFQVKDDLERSLNVLLINNAGQLVQNLNTYTNTPIQVSDLSMGLYTVILKTETSYATKKLVVR